jgi:hypothetical protein
MIRKTTQFATDAVRLAQQVGEVVRDIAVELEQRPRKQIIVRRVTWEEPFSLDVGLPSPPAAVAILRALNNDGGSDGKPSGVAWTWDRGRVRIDDVDGVTVGTDYTLTFEVTHA